MQIPQLSSLRRLSFAADKDLVIFVLGGAGALGFKAGGIQVGSLRILMACIVFFSL